MSTSACNFINAGVVLTLGLQSCKGNKCLGVYQGNTVHVQLMMFTKSRVLAHLENLDKVTKYKHKNSFLINYNIFVLVGDDTTLSLPQTTINVHTCVQVF